MTQDHHRCATRTGDIDFTLPIESESLNPSHKKSDHPLDDPRVRSYLYHAKLSGRELIDMSVKDLNKQFAITQCPPSVVNTLKRCRRTLKNRGYAKSCRIKRIAGVKEMQRLIEQKDQEIEKLRRQLRLLQPSSYLTPLAAATLTKIGGDTTSAYVYQNQLHNDDDNNNNYQQQQQPQWQQRESMEQVSCHQQHQHCYRTLLSTEMSYPSDLLEQDGPLEQVCQQGQTVNEKQLISESELVMNPTTNYLVDWATFERV